MECRAHAAGPQRIYFSSSTNGGENWLPRVSVSAAAPGVEHAFPAIAAGNNGDVRIAWMATDSRMTDSRKTPYWNTYYRSSSNGGATWNDETGSPAMCQDISTSRKTDSVSRSATILE